MKLPLLLVGICSGVVATAQTLELSDTLSTGDMMTYYVLDSNANAYADVTGTDVTWDYSEIGGYGLPGNVNEIVDKGDTDFEADYPSSVYAENFENNILSYFANDDDASEVLVYGFVFEDGATEYVIKYNDDPLSSLKFPMDVGDTYTDEIEGSVFVDFFGGIDVDIAGEATVTCDGSGDITVGDVTYSDVLRVHTMEVSEGEYLGATNRITRESYVYYDPAAGGFPVFVHGRILIELSIGGDIEYKTVYAQNEITELVGIEKNEEISTLAIFPNPALGNAVNVTLDQGSTSLAVFNSLGEELIRINQPKVKETINVSKFANGIYFVQVTKGNAIKTEKLVIK